MSKKENKKEENYENEEVDEYDLIYEAHLKIDALIDLLIEKKLINEKEFEDKLDQLMEEDLKEAEKD